MTKHIHFYKYQAAGNDFVMIDNRKLAFDATPENIVRFCDRRFGAGSDGLILLNPPQDGADFVMKYFNSDGSSGSMCGNGGRSIISFARFLGIIQQTTRFIAPDGWHEGTVLDSGLISLKMQDIDDADMHLTDYTMDTGAPHLVRFVPTIEGLDVYNDGRVIRYDPIFGDYGINVNFADDSAQPIKMATYEIGVEDETLACGTGATAVAIALAKKNEAPIGSTQSFDLQAKGGLLNVKFENTEKGATNVWLTGPATLVYEGKFFI